MAELGLGIGVTEVSHNIQINAVAFQEGGDHGLWVVQGIEYDIVAHCSSVEAIPDAFMRAVIENARITEHLGRKPLEGIRPAPDRFREMYNRSKTELKPVALSAPVSTMRPDLSVRVLGSAIAA